MYIITRNGQYYVFNIVGGYWINERKLATRFFDHAHALEIAADVFGTVIEV